LFSNGRCSIDQAIEEIRELLNEVHSVLSKGNSSLSPYSIVSLASIIKDIKKVHTHDMNPRTHARTHTHTRMHTHTRSRV
jgi:3-methyladenine DNA glycosylase AlkC